MDSYHPVACAVYACYELAILRRRPVMLGWKDETGLTRLGRVQPLDLETRSGEEFLIFRTAQNGRERVRLDRIVGFSAGSPGARTPL